MYSKMCQMMMANMLHERYHKSTGIAFSSIYPGCKHLPPLTLVSSYNSHTNILTMYYYMVLLYICRYC